MNSWRVVPGSRPGPTRYELAAVGVFVAVLAGYILAPPQVPDLAAQVARAEVLRRVGPTVWWQGWFGGLHLPTYSAFSPALMAALTPPVAGAISAAAAAGAMERLLR